MKIDTLIKKAIQRIKKENNFWKDREIVSFYYIEQDKITVAFFDNKTSWGNYIQYTKEHKTTENLIYTLSLRSCISIEKKINKNSDDIKPLSLKNIPVEWIRIN